MTWWGRRLPSANAWRAIVVIVLALAMAGCGRPKSPYMVDARTQRPPSLVPPDLALAYLQEIKSQSNRSLLAGETTIPPCRFADKGTWSGGEYRKVTGQCGPGQITLYEYWVVFKIEDPGGRDYAPADVARGGAWNYSLRTPRDARTVFGTSDHCIVGPTSEPARKVLEALSALGVMIAPEYGYIVR